MRYSIYISIINKKLVWILYLSFTLNLAFGQSDQFSQVKSLADQGKFQQAIAKANLILPDLSPSYSKYREVLQLRAYCFMAISDNQSAIHDFTNLIKIDSGNVSNYVGLSYVYWRLTDNKNCFKYIMKAYELNPRDINTLNNMSYFFGQAGQYTESIKYANEGLEQTNVPNTLKDALYNNRGFAYYGLKQYDKAMLDIKQAINLNPENSFAYFYRALVNIDLKEMENVCPDLEKAKSLGAVNLTKEYINKYCKK